MSPSNTENQFSSDHDLLIQLTVSVNSVRDEISQIKSDMSGRVTDHEARLRVVERDNEQLRGSRNAMRWMIGIATAVGAIIGPVIALIIGIQQR